MSGNGEQERGIVRQEFGVTETRRLSEVASSASAAQARALVEARYIMAMQRPRSWDQVRVRLLKDCGRPEFAEAAIFLKPVGDGIEGPSIRFAEAVMQHMGNLYAQHNVLYEDAQTRIVSVALTDLENNSTLEKTIVVTKTVERRTLKKGQIPIGEPRLNSKGLPVYLVEATDDDVLTKENALASKALRTHALRHLPPDIKAECLAMARKTRASEIAKDPDAAKKKVADAFAGLGVEPKHLAEYLGHDLATTSPAELERLRGLYAALRDGDLTWLEVMDAVREERAGGQTGEGAPSKSEQLAQKYKTKKAESPSETSEGPRAPATEEHAPEETRPNDRERPTKASAVEPLPNAAPADRGNQSAVATPGVSASAQGPGASQSHETIAADPGPESPAWPTAEQYSAELAGVLEVLGAIVGAEKAKSMLSPFSTIGRTPGSRRESLRAARVALAECRKARLQASLQEKDSHG